MIHRLLVVLWVTAWSAGALADEVEPLGITPARASGQPSVEGEAQHIPALSMRGWRFTVHAELAELPKGAPLQLEMRLAGPEVRSPGGLDEWLVVRRLDPHAGVPLAAYVFVSGGALLKLLRAPGETRGEMLSPSRRVQLRLVANDDDVLAQGDAVLASILPEDQDNARGRLFVLGQYGPKRVALVGGFGPEGKALDADALAKLDDRRFVGRPFAVSGTVGDNFAAVVVIDDSASMRKPHQLRMQRVLSEAVDALPAGTQVAVVSFGHAVHTVAPLSTDRAVAKAAIHARRPRGKSTVFYDAVEAAVDVLAKSDRPIRLMVLSSDGMDNGSMESDLRGAIQRLNHAGVFPVVLGADWARVDVLRRLVEPHGIYYYSRTYDAVAARFEPFTRALANLVAVRMAE